MPLNIVKKEYSSVVGKWRDKSAYLDNRTVVSTKRKWAMRPWKAMEERWVHFTEWDTQEANLERLSSARSQLHDNLERIQPGRCKMTSDYQELGDRDEQGEHKGILGRWKYPVYYHNGGYVSSCICSNSWNEWQAWTLMKLCTMGNEDVSIFCNAPPWWAVLIMGTVPVGTGGVYVGIYVLLLTFAVTLRWL